MELFYLTSIYVILIVSVIVYYVDNNTNPFTYCVYLNDSQTPTYIIIVGMIT